MDMKQIRSFTVRFDELNEDNKKYIIAILQALTFAQSTSEKIAMERTHEQNA
ncbi:hypothetical protein [Anaerotignum sp.]|uniref:hypothetical protein n=1 Tax=Anaerotignum sp. TaxID=2039241 RepID=UPI0028AE0B50|nr:hypothetical protein [Anaerotignum sp.]